MHKCRNCICKSCMNTCGCRNCKENDGAVKDCNHYSQFEQISLFPSDIKPIRQKLLRDVTWSDYRLDNKRYRKKLKYMCQDRKYKDIVRSAAYQSSIDIAEFLIKSVTKNKSWDDLEYDFELGRICIGRTDFYGYRRLFYHNFDKALKSVQNENDNMG